MLRRPIRRRSLLPAALALGCALAAVAFVRPRCPSRGLALTPSKAALSRLKNRDAPPRPEEFDPAVTLEALLAPGDDRARWSAERAATVEGYVVAVGAARPESANCLLPWRLDTHVDVALRADAPPRERVVLEVTPRVADAARARGLDWSAPALRRALTGRRCRFEGWLLYDSEHESESEHTAPARPGNWRATAWEIHPITGIECEGWGLGDGG
jgi:hypothetical protein